MTGSEDTSVVFHEGPPFKFMKSVQNSHTHFVNAVCFSADGSRAFSCASDGLVAIYTGDSGDLLSVLDPKLSCSIWGLAPSSQGTVFAACGDRKVRAISSDNCSVVSETTIGDGEVKDMPLGISADVKRNVIRTVSMDGTVRKFSVDENSALVLSETIHGSSGAISAIVPFRDVLYVTSSDGSVWSLAKPFMTTEPQAVCTKKPVKTSAGLLVDVLEVMGVSAQNDNELINIKTGDVKRIPIPANTTRLVRCQPVGYAIGAKCTAFARVHQPHTSMSVEEGIAAFAVSENGETTVVVPVKDRSRSLELQQEPRELLVNMRTKLVTEFRTADIVNVAVSPNSAFIAAASGAQELHVYKKIGAEKYEVVPATVKCWTYHKGRIGAMFWVDERFLITGGLDKALYVWDVERAMDGPAATLRDMHKEGVTTVFGYRDGSVVTIVSGGNEGCVRVTEVSVRL
jgi:WD40 repeat protein